VSIQVPPIWNSGWIEVICGGMFSGKTEELIRRIKRAQIARQKVQIFKPVIDDRYATDQVASHSELRIDARVISHPEEILSLLEDNTRVVAIDEAQFFKPLIVEISHRLANRGLRVIVAGLDLDYCGMPFGPMPALMCTAEMVTKMSAICTACGNPASRSQRLEGSNERSQILVGAGEIYEPRCRRCFEPPPLP
jgi:thymidine kinase